MALLSLIPAPIWSFLAAALGVVGAYLAGRIAGGQTAKSEARANEAEATVQAVSDYKKVQDDVARMSDGDVDRAASRWVRR